MRVLALWLALAACNGREQKSLEIEGRETAPVAVCFVVAEAPWGFDSVSRLMQCETATDICYMTYGGGLHCRAKYLAE